MPHRSWWVPQKSRAVDKKGVAVALMFLIALGALAGGRGDKRDRIEDLIQRTTVSASRDTLSTDDPALEGERTTMGQHMTRNRHPLDPGSWLTSVPWFSMPYLSGAFKREAFSRQSEAAYQQQCSATQPEFRMRFMDSGHGESSEILRSPAEGSSQPFQEVIRALPRSCSGPAHFSASILLTENVLSPSGE